MSSRRMVSTRTERSRAIVGWVAAAAAIAGCSPAEAPPKTPAAVVQTASATPAHAPIDQTLVANVTGAKPEASGAVVKVSFPRTELPVEVDGWAAMPPFMGLTSWAAFTPGEKPGVEAMVMGDVVLFEDEVNPVMSAALDAGLEVTALHNHFFFDKPHVLFMHIGGEGRTEVLAKGVKAALDAQRAIRQKSPAPQTSFGAQLLASPSHIDAAKLDALFGSKGTAKDGMYKAAMGRSATASCGCAIGKAMGVNTWAAFAGADDNAVVDGDFAVSEAELQPVLRALRHGGINIVAIHSHMTGETPRLLFLHYWGRGQASELAAVLKKALDLTAWDGRAQGT